jgi:hypothetical protein
MLVFSLATALFQVAVLAVTPLAAPRRASSHGP